MLNKNQMGNMFTIAEVAQLLHVHPNTLRRWCDRGKIRALKISTRGDRRFRQEDIARFLAELNADIGDKIKGHSI